MTQNTSALSHSAAPDSLSALRAAPRSESRAVEGSELPARLSQGPWKVVRGSSVEIEMGAGLFVECYAGSEANAKLIAAAPDLLAALRVALDAYDRPTNLEFQREAFQTARAAINRATS